jgi:Fe-S-cluster containining protein
MAPSYDCGLCPAYCCSYPRVIVSKRDLRRLAKHFGVDLETARSKYTKKGEEQGERVLRHRKDQFYKSVCRFLDPAGRHCTVYEARPGICREYPGEPRCGYFDFLSFERRAQEDPEFIPSA